jgi:deoxyribonuclease-4
MIRFGVAGYPIAFDSSEYRKDRLNIFKWLSYLGLDAFEMQMTYGPRTKEDTCREMRLIATDYGIKISVHASYYIVFTSSENDKIKQSKETLKRTYELANLLGSDIIVLHPGPLYGKEPNIVADIFLNNLETFLNNFGHGEIGLFLETAGKKGQLGSVDEIISFSQKLKGCFPCFDFGHIHARENGSLKNDKSIKQLFERMRRLGTFDDRYHIHYTPIDYSFQGGEIRHKAINDIYPIEEQQDLFDNNVRTGHYHPRYEPIIESLININADCTVISETHNSQEEGAKAMRDYLLSII